MSELRWNPTLSEWVITATHRQERTYHPPKNFCPLCPTVTLRSGQSRPGKFPTEVPSDDYDIVVFENKFPSLFRIPPLPGVKTTDLYPVKPSKGICEVVLYSPDHNSSLAKMPASQIYKLVNVWQDRYQELGSHKFIKYVLIFENKGEVIGVTLAHPHGQIYAFGFIPPQIKRQLVSAKKYSKKNNQCLFCAILKQELRAKKRIIYQNREWLAFVPFYARWPYEVHIYSRRHFSSLSDIRDSEKKSLAKILKLVTSKYDNLYKFSFPYMMIIFQSPTDGKEYDYFHFHLEFYPPYRSKDKLKYRASCETAAGTFINDTLPEEKATELRRVKPQKEKM